MKCLYNQWRLVPKIIGGAARKLATKLSWLKCRLRGHNVARCPHWVLRRHIVKCGRRAQMFVLQRHIPKKSEKLIENKRPWYAGIFQSRSE